MAHVVHAVSEGRRFATDLSLEVVTCASCRIVYAIPESLASSARAYPGGSPGGWVLCCPMGHEWHYTGKSIAEKLEDERRRAQATRDLLAAEERSHAATRGHLTRTKKRVAHGVCPCCNRTFKQLAAHMENKHPEYVEPERLSVDDLPTAGDGGEQSQTSGYLRGDVERIVRETGPVSPSEIVAALGYSNANSVGVALNRLKREGRLLNLGYGRWVCA